MSDSDKKKFKNGDTLVKDRHVSEEVLFVATARRLSVKIWEVMRKCPKSATAIFIVDVCHYANEMRRHVICANSIMVKTDADKMLKRKHLLEAFGLIDTLEDMLVTVQNYLEKCDKRCVTDNTWMVLGGMFAEERKLLSGVIKVIG